MSAAGGAEDAPAALAAWADRLIAAARSTLGDEAACPRARRSPEQARELVGRFCDESGSRRPMDGLLLRWRLGLGPPVGAVPARGADGALWMALLAGPSGAERSARATVSELGLDVAGDGPLVPPGGGAVEVWTEQELSAMHAGWHLSRRPEWSAAGLTAGRIGRAVGWFVEHVQPDNATNHPWAIHCFAAAGALGLVPPGAVAEADFCAQMMLHNSMVSLGRPDVVSAHILADAAGALVAVDGRAARGAG